MKTSLIIVTLSCLQKIIQLKPFLCFFLSGYTEKTTSIFYISDAKFIDAGVSKSISPAEKSTHLQQLAYVRSFPSGERNCYRINVTSGTKYLIRATFFYGNYDGLNQPPQFDLHLGPNLWDTVSFPNASLSEISEIIYTPSLDYIHPCLVNKGQGAPFISTIELRTLKNASYVTASAESLAYYRRYDLGSITNLVYRWVHCVESDSLAHLYCVTISFIINSERRPLDPSASIVNCMIFSHMKKRKGRQK